MSCSFLRDVPRLQNKNVSACRNRPRRFRLPTVGTITVGCQGLERSGKQKIFQALRNLEKFLRPLTTNCYCATVPASQAGTPYSLRPRRAVCNTSPSPQLLLEHISCVTSFSQGVKKTLDIRPFFLLYVNSFRIFMLDKSLAGCFSFVPRKSPCLGRASRGRYPALDRRITHEGSQALTQGVPCCPPTSCGHAFARLFLPAAGSGAR